MSEPRPPDSEERPQEEPLRGPFGGGAISLGRILGVRVGVDYSWAIIFLLVTGMLRQEFSETHENWPTQFAWLAGALTSLLYFISILLHELGHSVVSNGLGLPIHSITLFIFGGVARMTREPDRPRDEFLIAVAGPLVSAFLAMAFLDGFLLIDWAGLGGESQILWEALSTIFLNLAAINLILILFNCIPGFPLDGGRVFRSAVWALTGSFHAATRIAAACGGLFALGLIVLGGISAAAYGNYINGIWLAMLGWFLMTAARRSVAHMLIKESLAGALVADAFDRDLAAVPGRTSVQALIEGPILRERRQVFSVELDGEPSGLVSVYEALAVPEDERMNTPVQAISVPLDRIERVSPRETLLAALQKMDRVGAAILPVVENGALLGVLTREGMLRGKAPQPGAPAPR